MSAKHTKGPWRYDYEPGYCGELIAQDGTTIAEFVVEPSLDNARRIVACVNACEGFSIEELEGADLFKDSIESQDLIDGLLAALRLIVDNSIEGGLFNMEAKRCAESIRARG